MCGCDKKRSWIGHLLQGELTVQMTHYYCCVLLLLLLLIMSPIITEKILTEMGLDLKPLNILFHNLSQASKLERELIKDYKIG